MTPTTTIGPVYDALQVAALLGINYTAEQLVAFGPPPGHLQGFITFFDPGLSILRLKETFADKGKIFNDRYWGGRDSYEKIEETPCYRQLRMEAVKDSFGKTFAEQKALLPKDEEVSLARVVVMGMVVHYLSSGKWLYPDYFVQCRDMVQCGPLRNHVIIMSSYSYGSYGVCMTWDVSDRNDAVGLASVRKP